MRRRQGFTLVELLVAMALVIFIMAILTEAFSAGLTTFRQLKAIGDMQERMRSVAIVLRNDLRADHFADTNRTPNATRLSDIDLRAGGVPPSAGYFRIVQQWNSGTDPRTYNSTLEGTEAVGGLNMPSTTATNQWLAFTCKVPPSASSDGTPRPETFHSTPVPAGLGLDNPSPPSSFASYYTLNVMNSQWYEVAYFLKATGQSAGSTPLFALYRRERVIYPLVPPPAATNALTAAAFAAYPGVSVSPYASAGVSPVNTPGTTATPPAGATTSISEPRRRLGMDGTTLAGVPATLAGVVGPSNWDLADQPGTPSNQFGDDLLMSDVISFDIKVVLQGSPLGTDYPAFVDLPPQSITTGAGGTTTAVSSNNSTFAASSAVVFDTWSSYDSAAYGSAASGWNTTGQVASLPLAVRILAVQVTLRVWDSRTQQARQLAIIQDM
jgi:prepilin-type N-terminal cleavage/methylation domain-containing protein